MTDSSAKRKVVAGEKLRDADKVSRIPIKVVPVATPLAKPEWLRIKLPDPAQCRRVEALVAETGLHTVCQEAACPNLAECFHHGTATFMIMGDICTHGCELLTLGQYLQPSPHHLPVSRYVTPAEFEQLKRFGTSLGFSHVASGPFVRSSYHADIQAAGLVK